jgi:nitrogenase molybdenum-iron protein alpha/beta subunit
MSQENACPAPFGVLGTFRWLEFISKISYGEISQISKHKFIENKKVIDDFISTFRTKELRIAIEAGSWWAVGLGRFFVEELGCSVMLSSDVDAISYQDLFGQFATTLVDTGNYELRMEFEEFEPNIVFGSSYVNSSKWKWIPFWQPIFHLVKPYKPLMGWSGIPLLLNTIVESQKT